MWDFLSVTFFPIQSYNALIIDGLPNYPNHWAAWRDISWISVGYDTTCHRALTLPLKDRFDGVWSATTYNLKNLTSLIRCKTFYLWHQIFRLEWHGWANCAVNYFPSSERWSGMVGNSIIFSIWNMAATDNSPTGKHRSITQSNWESGTY